MLCNILFNIINFFYLILFEHIVFNFAYYYFDSLIYKGDLYFWESEFAMIAISIVLFFSKIFMKREAKVVNSLVSQCLLFSSIYILYCTLWEQLTCNYYVLAFIIFSIAFIFFLAFIILSIAFIFLEYISFINKKFTRLFYLTLFSIDVCGFIMCQTIFPAKDIPESFKFKKVDTNLRKFIIKSKFKK